MCAASQIGGLNRQAMHELNHGNAANAEFLLFQALRAAKAQSLMGFLPKLHNSLGLVFLLSGRPVLAVDAFSQALSLAEKHYAGATRFHTVLRRQLAQAQQEAQGA